MTDKALPAPEMLALESQLEALGDWRAQLDAELAQMAEQTRRISQLAQRTRYRELGKMAKHMLARTCIASGGLLSAAEYMRWTKDELISAIIDSEMSKAASEKQVHARCPACGHHALIIKSIGLCPTCDGE